MLEIDEMLENYWIRARISLKTASSENSNKGTQSVFVSLAAGIKILFAHLHILTEKDIKR